jgi:hypothetical protein
MMRRLPSNDAAAFIVSVLGASEAADRLAAKRPRPPQNLRGPSRQNPDPEKRRRNPVRDYGLLPAELPEWRWLMTRKNMTAIEAANVLLRSRKQEASQ